MKSIKTKKAKKIYIKEFKDLLKYEWKVDKCTTENCWCAWITTKDPIYFKSNDKHCEEAAYIAPSGAIPKELAEHIVELHNLTLKV